MLFYSRAKFLIEQAYCQDPGNIIRRKSPYGLFIAGACYYGVFVISSPGYARKARRASVLVMLGMKVRRFKSL
jgi:hypothetical protein